MATPAGEALGAPLGSFGALFRRHREQRGGLREWCMWHRFQHALVSKIERGVEPPPESFDVLRRYALALKLAEGSDDWRDFFDAAAAERKAIPADIREALTAEEMAPVIASVRRAADLTRRFRARQA